MSVLTEIIEEAATVVLTLTEGLEREEFLRSRITRPVVTKQLLKIADALAETRDHAGADMPELDWDAWLAMGPRLAQDDEALWFVIHALTPATLSWVRFYGRPESAEPSLH